MTKNFYMYLLWLLGNNFISSINMTFDLFSNSLCVLVLRVLDFNAGGVGFNPLARSWKLYPQTKYFTHMCPFSIKSTNGYQVC